MIEEFFFNYCPWLSRLTLILRWFYRVMQDQVNPGLVIHLYPTSLWPGWDWATLNATYSSRASPWHFSWMFSAIEDPDGIYDDDEDF